MITQAKVLIGLAALVAAGLAIHAYNRSQQKVGEARVLTAQAPVVAAKVAQVQAGDAKGPARGLWQNEQGGGVRGVLNHEASHVLALKVCQVRGVVPTPTAVWARMEFDDVLAAALARLLYFTDPKSLPVVEDVDGAWALYLRTWRPGKPKPDTWPSFHARARTFVLGTS